MAAIALPSFLNRANRLGVSTARTSNREIDSLTGMSETRIGTAAFTLKQPHSDVESNRYVGSLNRGQQAFLYGESVDFLTDMSGTLAGMAPFTFEQSRFC